MVKKDCPKLKDLKNDDKFVSARVFALTKGEAKTSNAVVTGQITISGKLCNVLFNSGATHSFISVNMKDRLDKPYELFRDKFVTKLPSGEVMLSSRGVHDIVVRVEGRDLPVDLIKLDLKDYGVILGIDSLARHRATIDYKSKIVNLRIEGRG
ncbi:uncharacterized protein LOC133805572 [Humulus lupulus]|uniref:uncharacterized protein LOC133805572 n=1 Tax=Humulus lupulus TaxID=3486 RepID=UPI002B40B040|nr:uncharacterized protein LOC133805572 [Humulus lupulus]